MLKSARPGTGGGGNSSGTVTTVSVVTANGFSGTVANPTTTPAITLHGPGGTVTSMSVVTANGYSGTVANPTTTPAITINGPQGTVTSMSVATANGFSGSVANPTTTPEITLDNPTQLDIGPVGGCLAEISGGAVGFGQVQITAVGSDTDIWIDLQPKGVGQVTVNSVPLAAAVGSAGSIQYTDGHVLQGTNNATLDANGNMVVAQFISGGNGTFIQSLPQVVGALADPAVAGNGARAFVSDSTLAYLGVNIGTPVVGGDAHGTPVVVVGGVWVIG